MGDGNGATGRPTFPRVPFRVRVPVRVPVRVRARVLGAAARAAKALLGLGLSLACLNAPGAAAPRSGTNGVADPQARQPDDVRRASLAALSAEIFELDAAGLDERAATRRAEGAERPLIAAIVLRAGRPIPPTLSSARQVQREARAREARAWLETEAASSPEGRARVRTAIVDALQPPAGATMLPDLAVAAMEVAVALDMVDLAPVIAPQLGADRRPVLREAARLALFRLFGRWFDGRAAFAVFWAEAEGLSTVALGRDELIRREDRADELFVALLGARPGAAPDEPLWDRRPRAAARVASALSGAIAAGAIAPDDARRLLRDGIEDERRAGPLHARLQVLLDLVQGSDPSAAPAREVAALLDSICADAANLAPGRAWVVIGGLPRLPYAPEEAGDAARARSLRRGTEVLRVVLARPAFRPLDPDALQGAVGALIDLADAIADDRLRGECSEDLVEILGRLVTTTAPVPVGVRRAAASGLRLSSTPDHAQMLIDVVKGLEQPALEYELIGALRAAIAVLEPGSDEVGAVLQRLFETMALPDFDARSRALGVLESEDVAAALAAFDPKQRRLRAKWIKDRIRSEASPELRRSLVVVFGRLDQPETLSDLLGDAETLAVLARDGAESTGALGDAIRRTCAGDRRALLDASSAVINAASATAVRGDEVAAMEGRAGGAQLEQRSVRVALLRLGSSLGLEACAPGDLDLAPADHARILDAAIELLRVERALGRAAALTVAQIELLLRDHVAPLESAGRDAEPYKLDRLVARALLGARLITRAGAATDLEPAYVIAAFEAADGAMPTTPGTTYAGWTRFDLRVEEARFLRDLGRRGAALARFDDAIVAESTPDGPPDPTAPVARDYVEILFEAANQDAGFLSEVRALRAAALLESVAARAPESGAERERAWLQQAVLGAPGAPAAWGEGPRRVRDLLGEMAPARLTRLVGAVEALAPTDSTGGTPLGG